MNLAQRRQELARLKQLQATLGVSEQRGAGPGTSLSEALLLEIIRDALADVGEVRLNELGKYLTQRTGFAFQQQQGGLKGFMLRHSDTFMMVNDLPDNPLVSLRSRGPASLGMPPLPPLQPNDPSYAHLLASLSALAGSGKLPASPPVGPLQMSAFSPPMLSPGASPAGPRPGGLSGPPSLSPPSSATASPSLSPYGNPSPSSPTVGSSPWTQHHHHHAAAAAAARFGSDPQSIWSSAAAAAALRQVQAQHHAAAAAAAAAVAAAQAGHSHYGAPHYGHGSPF
eukprot:tig00020556_g11039.t1